jgi:hypothetical protein
MKKSLRFSIGLIFAWIFLSNFASAFLISDQGTDVKDVTTGDLIVLANLTILIYDNLTSGTLIFGQNFTDAIVNGSWNIMTDPSLEYGKSYYKDYQINGEDLDFDGNERLEFQSSVGDINNVSFINFSLISSCSAGSSIRLIYENGSVVCEVDDGLVSSDLTNYALKNQSETFAGNITTSETGFFGFLGSILSRITGLFVQDIDFNGTINGSGNITTTGNISADYLRGDGSLLTNLPGGDNSSWNQTHANTVYYSISNPSTFWNATFALFNKTYADTLYADISVTGDNSSWNQTHANTVYYSISNPSTFWNATFALFNKTYADTLYADISVTGDNSSWNQTHANTVYYSISNPSTFWNATFALFNKTYADTLYADISVTGDNSSWNESHADTLYADISVTGDNSSWNESHADTLYLNRSGTNANQDINISPYNFQAGNLTLAQKITFSLGEIMDNIVDGWIKITGSLDISGDVEVGGWANVSGDLNVSGNITSIDTFCFTADCSAKMYHNGTGIIITG